MPMYRSTVKTTMIQADVKRNTYEINPYIEHITEAHTVIHTVVNKKT